MAYSNWQVFPGQGVKHAQHGFGAVRKVYYHLKEADVLFRRGLVIVPLDSLSSCAFQATKTDEDDATIRKVKRTRRRGAR